MLQIKGRVGDVTLTGTLYERGERPPRFRGSPDDGTPYVWVCDEFYQVESGGTSQEIDGRTVNIAFESPLPRGFDRREAAIEAAREHIRTQFARIGVGSESVSVDVVPMEPDSIP